MSPGRFSKVPAVVCFPRSSLDNQISGTVDSALKDLKNSTRKLQIVLRCHIDEMQLLERLYYKGKNQHRSALFWNRLEEVRKYGKRLQEVNIFGIIELLRCSFFGMSVIQNPKAMKGSWSHYPDSRYMLFLTERISSCLLLLEKGHTRLSEAYQFFVICMQSGYFIQLMLTIAAITSRLDIFVLDLQRVLQDSRRIAVILLSTLHPKDASEQTITPAKCDKSRDFQVDIVEEPPGRNEGISGIPDEDIGTLAEPVMAVQSYHSEGGQSGLPIWHAHLQQRSSITDLDPSMVLGSAESPTVQEEGSATDAQLAEGSSTSAQLPQRHGAASGVSLTREASSMISAPSPVATKRKAKDSKVSNTGKPKKRKKRDEIDDIFGFLA